MMQAPDIGGMIFEHTADAHALHLPFVGSVALPQWAPVHVGGMAIDLSPTRHVVFLLLAAFLVWLTMWLTGRALVRQRAQGSGAPRGVASMIEAMVLFVRNDVAIANIGHRGAAFAPYVLTLFWLILYCNLLGLLPFGATPTGNLAVTGALAFTALLTIEISGMVALGPRGYAKTIVFVPPGMTGIGALLLTLIMIPVEVIGKIVKPFALMLRLFANMTAGHFVILSLMGMIFIFGHLSYARWVIAGGSVAFILFMYALELLVAVLQAYIFALLVSVFIGLMQHEH
ncbi:MAG: F0F1 ATP synthase subunit A [Gemmatimonadales bacterium]|nr:MAG: F0F1 ATP synthase subunit A [Gemmatimonadales bacterium]